MITKKVTGLTTETEAEQRRESLKEAYEIGYGFYPLPITQADDGTWGFEYSRGSSCD